MKKLSKLIFIIGLFILIPKVHAANLNYWLDNQQYDQPAWANAYNWSSETAYNSVGVSVHLLESSSGLNSSLSYTSFSGYVRTYGMSYVFSLNETLSTNYLYTINSYLCVTGGITINDIEMTTGNKAATSFSNVPAYSYTNYGTSVGSYPFSDYETSFTSCYVITSIVQPSLVSVYANLHLWGSSDNPYGEYSFLGFTVENMGLATSLKTSDIQNIINSSDLATASDIEEVQTAINEVKTELNDVNSSIEEQTQQQQQNHEETMNTITSESEDTESSSCGIICKLKGIFTGIIELPGKLINLLIDALKSLFIPTEEQIQEIIDDSQTMAENFGFVGEIVAFLVDTFTSLLNISQENGCITFPEFSLDFSTTPIGKTITFWDGTDVCMSDNAWFGADSVGIVTLRLISTLTLVILFVNFCYREYWKIMSKESD